MQQVLEECTKLKDKYKKKKALLAEANSELEQLRASAASSAARTSLERRERNSRKRKATNEDEQPIDTVTVQRVHLNYQEAPRAEQGDAHVVIGDEPVATAAKDPREIVKRDLDVSNIREFLGVSSSDILKEPSLEHCQRLTGKDKWTELHTKLWTARIDRQMKYCADDSIIWCPRSSMRCIFVHPVHCYTPETQCYRTFDYRDFMRQGETKDLCLSKGITSLYCGTYRCIAVSDMHMAELFQLLLTNQIGLTTYLVNRVMVLGPFTSPASGASKSQVLLDAFMDGNILVRCHRLEYVGRNSAVSAFYAQCANDKSIHGQPEHSSDDGCKSRKRLRKGQ
ncbi:hypothetical protein DAEQUDRAFT_610833 [Daedalea quercina L-15889]|uniref:Uncharacterized protein n=1 Tax=Daedalea quercina L-15889 TaxID=1314783 RepID=A0A165LHB9_9APHY|nr:hypothetical protein DAEQUDRAFT_610833 [Daedalea quercina L-15889]